ncbi:MAG: DUF350 domain-containing protein [Deltaproteobacteria bacterium]|nr:MAG: DUF350 domain-containing protein [Deltaproteobacteria bacterium]
MAKAPLAGLELVTEQGIRNVLAALLYSLIGVVLFGVVWLALTRLTPFSIRKEIEEDQNTALGIILGAVILGVALIISAAIGG